MAIYRSFGKQYEAIEKWNNDWEMTRLKLKATGYPLNKIKIVSKNPTKRINRFAGMKGEENFE